MIMKIFLKNVNRNSKVIPMNKITSDSGKTRYFPSFSREWKNIIYTYNKNRMKDLPINDINMNKIIKSYFNLYFRNYKFSDARKFILLRRRRKFMRNIHLSNAEIKHTNDKAIVTLYTINREKYILRKKFLDLNNQVNKNLIQHYLFFYKKNLFKIYYILDKFKNDNQYRNILLRNLLRKKRFLQYKINYLKKFLELKHLYTEKLWSLLISKYTKKYLKLVRKYDLIYSLNEYKFNNNIFLPILTGLLKQILGERKIEYNIIHLKSIVYNTDIFTNILALKLRKQKVFLQRNLTKILTKANFPIVNTIKERTYLKGEKNLDSFKNKYKDMKILSHTSNNDFSKLLHKIYSADSKTKYNNQGKIHNSIFNSIYYKNLSGIRIEVNGRLTKRYRADRSVHSLKWKGGLKNIDSSFKRLSSVLFRGNTHSNITYSLVKSKRRIGAFAVKGWISGK